MGLKLKLAVLLDMKVESTTLPCSFLLTKWPQKQSLWIFCMCNIAS